jgi:hypothetical protein
VNRYLVLVLACLAAGCGKKPPPPATVNPLAYLPTREQTKALKPAPPPWEIPGAMEMLPRNVKLPAKLKGKLPPPPQDIKLPPIDSLPLPPPPPPVPRRNAK